MWYASDDRRSTDFRVVSGSIRVDGGAGPIRPGATVAVHGNSSATILLGDGSLAQLQPATEIVFSRTDGKTRQKLQLMRGEIGLSVTPSSKRFQVQVAKSSVTVLGTRFAIAAGDNGFFSVQVDEGRVRVEHLGQSVEIAAGERRDFLADSQAVKTSRGRLIAWQRDEHLVVRAGRQQRSLDLTPDFTATVTDKVPLKRAAAPGASIEVAMDASGRAVAMRILQPRLRGNVLSISRQGLTLTPADDDLPIQTWPLADDVRIARGNRVLSAGDLQAGDDIQVTLSSDWSEVHRISLTKARKTKP
jgi:hypothetical protein